MQEAYPKETLPPPMLFILVMEVLNSLIRVTDDLGLLQPLPARAIDH